MRALGIALLIGTLLAILVAASWWAFGLWRAVETDPLPWALYVALAGGVIFSLLVGCGLMALVFYSSRRGYDDDANSGLR